MIKLKLTAPLMVATLVLAGCANQPFGNGTTGNAAGTGIGGGELLGTLGGAGLGGLAGNQIGRGSGKTVATVGGVLLGGFLGNRLGNMLDQQSAASVRATTQQTLETAPPGQALPWSNSQNGNHGTVVAQAPYQNPQGTFCREYTQTVYIGGQQQQAVGTACRNPDGSWTPVSTN